MVSPARSILKYTTIWCSLKNSFQTHPCSLPKGRCDHLWNMPPRGNAAIRRHFASADQRVATVFIPVAIPSFTSVGSSPKASYRTQWAYSCAQADAYREVGDAFIDAGFSLISLANNRRERAVLRSLEYWSGKDSVLTAGSHSSQTDRDETRTVEVNGTTCAFLA